MISPRANTMPNKQEFHTRDEALVFIKKNAKAFVSAKTRISPHFTGRGKTYIVVTAKYVYECCSNPDCMFVCEDKNRPKGVTIPQWLSLHLPLKGKIVVNYK